MLADIENASLQFWFPYQIANHIDSICITLHYPVEVPFRSISFGNISESYKLFLALWLFLFQYFFLMVAYVVDFLSWINIENKNCNKNNCVIIIKISQCNVYIYIYVCVFIHFGMERDQTLQFTLLRKYPNLPKTITKLVKNHLTLFPQKSMKYLFVYGLV